MNILIIMILLLAACSPQTEQQAAGETVRQYLMDNPEITLEIVEHALRYKKNQESKAKTDALNQAREALTRGALSASQLGSVSEGQGDITLVEFFDYRCGYCKRAYPALTAAVKKDRRIRVIYKEFPILGEVSTIAARAAMAAGRQNKYLIFHRALMTTPGRLSEAKIFQIAKDIGLDTAKLRRDMKNRAINDAIAKNYALARELSITGTPSFVIFNRSQIELIVGARTQEEFTALFQKLRSSKQSFRQFSK